MKKAQEAPDSNRRVKIIGGVGIGLLVLMLGYRMMSSGGSADHASSTAPASAPSPGAAAPGV
ncbi:MAG TPA: hypothetical protein VFH70_04785, partial [Acidimicrobiales bacterium]|nr:hypothetical protein [Acidimicrobiales bacterium]